jgi:hypothetical protein
MPKMLLVQTHTIKVTTYHDVDVPQEELDRGVKYSEVSERAAAEPVLKEEEIVGFIRVVGLVNSVDEWKRPKQRR